MIKYTVLTSFNVVATAICVGCILFINITSVHVSIDVLVNSFCLFIMSKFYDNMYRSCFVCISCHKCVINCCYQRDVKRLSKIIGGNENLNIRMMRGQTMFRRSSTNPNVVKVYENNISNNNVCNSFLVFQLTRNNIDVECLYFDALFLYRREWVHLEELWLTVVFQL